MNGYYRFVYWVLRIVYIVIYPWRVIGAKNIPQGGALICPNHTSNIDPVLVVNAFTMKNPIRAMAKYEMSQWPIAGFLLKKSEAMVFVKRGEADISAIKNAMKMLKNNEKLLVFPEGTRGGEEALEGKNGAAMLASRTHVPIIPVYIPAKKRCFHATPVVIGEPYHPILDKEKSTAEAYQAITDDLMNKIAKLGDELR